MSAVYHNIRYWGDAIQALADELGVETAALHAVAAVEVGEIRQVDDGLPTIRFEVHVCLKRATKDMSSVIKLQNVPPLDAWSKDAQWYKTVGSWRRVHSGSQGDEWGALGAAARVDGIAALESASYGVGQLMGWHYAMLGYASPKEMVSYAMQGVVRQIEQWGIYLRKEEGGKLLSAMKAKDWYSFAYIYNGPGQPEKYAKNIAKQYDVAVEALAEGVPPDFDLTTWRGRQEALAALGYDPGPIDGIPGSKTKSAIKAFQADRQLNPDGIWGPRTEKAMQEELAKP